MAKTIALISLGCAKNLVNSEQMLYLLDEAGFVTVPDPDGADAAIVNTCGFIDSAKAEAIDHILRLGQLKAEGRLGKLIVTGCLAQRYREEILSDLPEVDALLGVGSYDDIVEVVSRCLNGADDTVQDFGDKNRSVEETPRVVSTGPGWAYLKIAEGCDNCCAFCAIPAIRGRYRSRPFENILEEAEALAEAGIGELIVIAQDITRYGTDNYGRPRLAELIRELCKIPGVRWVRLHYLYPDAFTPELIDTIAQEEKVVKYLDIPIQHINDDILRRMNRRGTGGEIRTLLTQLRDRIPELVLRTSLIVGLPGEGEAEYEQLCDFLAEYRLERVGVFPFSPEEGTPAAKMTDRCDADEAARRADRILEMQAEIMDQWCESKVGQTLPVLCEGWDEESECHWGRSAFDSPDIDGRVLFRGGGEPGEFVEVEITGCLDGDLIGERQ